MNFSNKIYEVLMRDLPASALPADLSSEGLERGM